MNKETKGDHRIADVSLNTTKTVITISDYNNNYLVGQVEEVRQLRDDIDEALKRANE